MNLRKIYERKFMGNSRYWHPPIKCKSLVIFGLGDLAQIAHEYFEGDSEYRVVGFTVDREFMPTNPVFCGLPVVPFDEVEKHFLPESHEMYCALVYFKMNRCRDEVCKRAKAKGYSLASYVSSYAFVSPSTKLGEHCFVFEGNVIQTNAVIGDNVILWSSNHIGHGSIIEKDNFISSHVVVSGHCNIGSNCFLGVNSTLANNTKVGEYSWISHGAILSGSIPPNSFVKSVQSEVVPLNEDALMRALERARV